MFLRNRHYFSQPEKVWRRRELNEGEHYMLGASMEQRWDEKSLPHRRHTSRTAEATRSAAKEAATSIVRGAPKSGRGRGAEAYPEGRCG